MAKGCKVTTASRKMMVRPASRMLSAISLGVFWRSAPSTSAIMRSRKVSPGLEVTLTRIWSERTRVPPVTAERSPPASRMTGADSPVMADSSTDATPSMISPSEGMYSPAETTTTSPARSLELGICSIVPSSRTRLAMVSERALRRVSACALPRPSAMASAKLAKSTVNQSQRVICRLKRKWVRSRTSKTVVMTLPTSTTNMTGLPIMWRGSSLRSASRAARRTILPSQTARLELLPAISIASECLACCQQQVLQDRPQAQRREEGQRTDDDDHTDQKRGEQRGRDRKSAQGWRHIFLLRQIARDGEHGNDHEEASEQHIEAKADVVPRGVDGQAAEGRAVVARAGDEGVEHLR